MADKLNKREYIQIIVDKLNNEGVTYSDCFQFFADNFSTIERTFANYWKEANEIHSEQRREINEEKQRIKIKEEIKAEKSKILKRTDNLAILSEIALSDKQQPKDRIKAIEVINKMQGYNQPEDININGTLTFLDFLKRNNRVDD